MLHWAFIFLLAAIFSALLGFGGAVATAKTLFLVFLVLCVMSLIMGAFLERPTGWNS